MRKPLLLEISKKMPRLLVNVQIALALGLASALLIKPVWGQISITEIQPLKYPAVVKNATSSSIVVVNWKGNLGSATNVTLLDNDYHNGQYFITSDTDLPITINFYQLGNENKVNLKTLRVRYKGKTLKNFPAVDLDNPGPTGEYLEIGAKVVAGKKADSGLRLPQYVLEVTEQ
ncbi:hypothetical protein [Shewanella waksmanii]|uniref:hypothetical protein n=1 Tax=Shewanella waksmanii TaxID=213783 RepID=UPI003734F31C